MASRSLSPKRIQERVQRHRQAVMVLALMRAKNMAQIRAKGQRISDYSNKEISHVAHDYLAQHGERLRAESDYICSRRLRDKRQVAVSNGAIIPKTATIMFNVLPLTSKLSLGMFAIPLASSRSWARNSRAWTSSVTAIPAPLASSTTAPSPFRLIST